MRDTAKTATLLEALAEFAHGIDLTAAPDAVAEQAALCLLDTVGCMVAGSRVSESGQLVRAESKRHGDFSTWPQDVAARALGYFGDTLELNDLIGGHSSIGVVTAVLSATRHQPATGVEVLRAIVAGTEVTCRLYDSSVGRFKRYSDSGAVMVSYFNAIGAAAALSLLAGFDRKTTAHAMAIAGSLNTWCPAEVIFGQGGTIKPMLFGANPAASAVQAVGYAGEGLTGPLDLIESPIGLMASLATTYEQASIVDTDRWFITTPQRKMHAACGYTHPSIDAASKLRLSAEEQGRVDAVDVAVPAFFKEAVGKEGQPKSPNDARFHLGYVVSLALQGLAPIMPEHSEDFVRIFSEGATASLSEKVRIVPQDDIAVGTSKPYNVSRVTVRFTDGSERTEVCTSPIGSSENPMSGAEVLEKFVRLVGPAASAETAGGLSERILAIAGSPDVTSLTRELLDLVRTGVEAPAH